MGTDLFTVLALHHLAVTDTLGNLVNGLGQINGNALHNDSPAQKFSTPWYRTVVWGESITAVKARPLAAGTAGKPAAPYLKR